MVHRTSHIVGWVQALALLFIAFCFAALMLRTQALARSVDDLAFDVRSNAFSTDIRSAETPSSATPSITLSAEDVRHVVRAELALFAAAFESEGNQRGPTSQTQYTQSAVQPDPAETARQVTDVDTAMAGFMFRGRASSAEMADLQAMIARLPPPERDRALLQLNRAMNSGAIDAPM